MIKLPFHKMHGLGNCFIVMDDRQGEVSDRLDVIELTRKVCDRNFGIGADGLLLVRPSNDNDLTMRIINEDGSEAEMCGNGIRCFARFVFDQGISADRRLKIDTLAGVIETNLLEDGRVEVDMGRPIFESDDVVADGTTDGDYARVETEGFEFGFVSMGNPHAITFVDEIPADWRETGARVESNAKFPNRTNVEFVKVRGDAEVEVSVWERGCGETMACGTGACAVVVAGARQGVLPRRPVTVQLPGGPLLIHWNDAGRVMMTGPAEPVCTGEYLFC